MEQEARLLPYISPRIDDYLIVYSDAQPITVYTGVAIDVQVPCTCTHAP